MGTPVLIFLDHLPKTISVEVKALTSCLLVGIRGWQTRAQALNRKGLSTLMYINEYGFIVSVRLS